MEANDIYPMITLYRAKKLNSKEYIIGYLSRIKNQLIIDENKNVWEYLIEPERNLINVNSLTDDNIANVTKNIYAIDNSTLAIHFEDMVDSKKKRIFASLNKTGKGGDMCVYVKGHLQYEEPNVVAQYKKGAFFFIDIFNGRFNGKLTSEWCSKFRSLGIKE